MPQYPIPQWLDRAYRYRGLKEIPGKRHNPIIVKWLKTLRAAWSDDEVPWCGTFVREMMRQVNLSGPQHWYRALAWATWGISVTPRMGAVMVKKRKGGGHVFFYAGETNTHYLGLGGNQANCVNITPFPKGEIIACRWPVGVDPEPYKPNYTTLAAADGKQGGGES